MMTTRKTDGTRSIVRVAEEVVRQLDIAPGADLVPIVEAMGGRIGYREFFTLSDPDCISLEIRDRYDFSLWLPTRTEERRNRFLIAHDLGHYFLHYLPLRRNGRIPDDHAPVTFGYYANDNADIEANIFAANLLAPRRHFLDLWARLDGAIMEIAAQLNVTGHFVDLRAQGLGLLERARRV